MYWSNLAPLLLQDNFGCYQAFVLTYVTFAWYRDRSLAMLLGLSMGPIGMCICLYKALDILFLGEEVNVYAQALVGWPIVVIFTTFFCYVVEEAFMLDGPPTTLSKVPEGPNVSLQEGHRVVVEDTISVVGALRKYGTDPLVRRFYKCALWSTGSTLVTVIGLSMLNQNKGHTAITLLGLATVLTVGVPSLLCGYTARKAAVVRLGTLGVVTLFCLLPLPTLPAMLVVMCTAFFASSWLSGSHVTVPEKKEC